MAPKTTTVFIIVALFVLQGSDALLISRGLAALERTAESYINSTITTIQNIATNVGNTVTSAGAAAQDNILGTIRNIQATASTVQECSVAVSDKLATILRDSRNNLTGCVSSNLQSIQPAVISLTDDLQKISVAVRTAIRDGATCGFDLFCGFGVLLNGQAKTSEINFSIASHIIDLERDAFLAGSNGTQCVQEKAAEAGTKIQAVAQETQQCIS